MGGGGNRKRILGQERHLFHPFGNMAAPARFDNNPSSIEASGKDSPFGGRGGGNLVVDAQLPNEHVGNLGGCTACPVGSQLCHRRDAFCTATRRSVVENVNARWYAPNERTVVVDIADTSPGVPEYGKNRIIGIDGKDLLFFNRGDRLACSIQACFWRSDGDGGV